MVHRLVAGGILIGLGLGLFGSQLQGPTERLAFGVALLALWAGTGLAVLAGMGWARIPGAILAMGGIVVGAVVVALANSGEAGWAADLFFTVDGPEFSWSARPDRQASSSASGSASGAGSTWMWLASMMVGRPSRSFQRVSSRDSSVSPTRCRIAV